MVEGSAKIKLLEISSAGRAGIVNFGGDCLEQLFAPRAGRPIRSEQGNIHKDPEGISKVSGSYLEAIWKHQNR